MISAHQVHARSVVRNDKEDRNLESPGQQLNHEVQKARNKENRFYCLIDASKSLPFPCQSGLSVVKKSLPDSAVPGGSGGSTGTAALPHQRGCLLQIPGGAIVDFGWFSATLRLCQSASRSELRPRVVPEPDVGRAAFLGPFEGYISLAAADGQSAGMLDEGRGPQCRHRGAAGRWLRLSATAATDSPRNQGRECDEVDLAEKCVDVPGFTAPAIGPRKDAGAAFKLLGTCCHDSQTACGLRVLAASR